MTERGTPGAPPLRVLSLDGGGIRGISSILILENLMEKIRDVTALKTVPRPCEYFDLIGGTSTGGIIATMLGRLGMTATECVRAYTDLAQQAFTPKRTTILPASPAGAYSAKALELAIAKAVRTYCVVPECAALRNSGRSTVETCPHGDLEFEDKTCTKTVVLAITKNDVDAPPTLFTTYDLPARFSGSTICQVARATSAATTFFKPATVGREGIEFVDAAFGYNNPCEVLIGEAQRQFPDRKQLQVVSIGTGLGDVVSIKDSRRSIIVALKKMATSSKEVATRLEKRYGGTEDCDYFRLNADQGLQDITLSDWQKVKEISGHTHNYLERCQILIERLANTLARVSVVKKRDLSQLGLPIHHLSTKLQGTSIASATTDYLPLPRNKRFVGRDQILKSVQRKLFEDDDCQRAAIVGLGGVGKTQLALQLAYWTKEQHPEYSIFWAPMLSNATFDQAYTEIAKRLPLPKPQNGAEGAKEPSPREAVLQYLSSEAAGPWLLIIDNADDNNLFFEEIENWIPESDRGLVLLTTRSQEVAVSFAGADVVELDRMDESEAARFLTKSLIHKSLVDDAAICKELLDELTYLPLAISQAAAYLNTNKLSVAEYLRVLRTTEQSAIGLLSRDYRDKTRYAGSQNAVATTWLVSFEQIRKSDESAAMLLEFLSCIEPKSIPGSILPKLEPEEMAHAIGTLCGYSFLTKRGGTDTYDMHSLVHLATRIWIQRDGRQLSITEKAITYLDEIFPNYDYANREVWRRYFPHAMRALRQTGDTGFQSKFHLMYMMARCLYTDERDAEALEYLVKAFEWAKDNLPEYHDDRLRTQKWLGVAYARHNRTEEALKLLKELVAYYEKTVPENHGDRLGSQYVLAEVYRAVKEHNKSIELLEKVVAIEAGILDEQDPNRLQSQNALAKSYMASGKYLNAVSLLKEVTAKRSLIYDMYHPSRLRSEYALAIAYRQMKQPEKAAALLESVVAKQGHALPDDHSDYLCSQFQLGKTYCVLGRHREAIALVEGIVSKRSKSLKKYHPNLLNSQFELAKTYLRDGQVDRAIEMHKEVLDIRTKTLPDDHKDRLNSEYYLASAYRESGDNARAIGLLRNVVAKEGRWLPKDHPNRLESENALAIAYYYDGQTDKAVEILMRVVEVRRRTLPEGHESRISSETWLEVVKKAVIRESRGSDPIPTTSG